MRTKLLLEGVLLLVATVFIWSLSAAFSINTVSLSNTVPITLWAWEHDEDISFLKSPSISVAYYAGTIYVLHDLVFFKPRLQKLQLGDGYLAYPVFRVETRSLPNQNQSESINSIADIIRKYQIEHHNTVVQIDYDATLSERAFYAAFLSHLRNVLAPGTHISITALASWCIDDRWLKHGQADEAVVMLFSMGSTRNEVFEMLTRRKLDTGAHINMSIGISANEETTNKKLKTLGILSNANRIYVFNSLPWTRSRFETINHEVLQYENCH